MKYILRIVEVFIILFCVLTLLFATIGIQTENNSMFDVSFVFYVLFNLFIMLGMEIKSGRLDNKIIKIDKYFKGRK